MMPNVGFEVIMALIINIVFFCDVTRLVWYMVAKAAEEPDALIFRVQIS
jgi:hypothetical protein